jgi:cephalosporin hydroxylase
MRDPQRIIEGAYALGTIQTYEEFLNAIEFVLAQKISSFIEVGTDKGGTFYAWTCCSDPGLRISVDIPHGEFGSSQGEFSEDRRNKILGGYPGECHFISGSSYDPKSVGEVARILNGRKVDFLFIDGDHTEEGVTKDFFLYKDFVREGGWIAFHDIKSTEFHHERNCRVDALWSKLHGNKFESVHDGTVFGGFGFIQKNSDLKYV